MCTASEIHNQSALKENYLRYALSMHRYEKPLHRNQKLRLMQNSNSTNYSQLLLTTEWKEKRKIILERDGHKCRSCGSEEALQVHHRQYHIDLNTGLKLPPWQYNTRYLVSLCTTCHKNGHDHYQVPTKFI
jgi:5-methylcytosine-specific restriction endonuclease McrA